MSLLRPKVLHLLCLLITGLFICACGGPGVENQTSAQVAARYEGKIIKHDGPSPDDQKIYLVSGGKRHWIPSMNWFAANGRNAGDVLRVTREELTKIPESDPAK